MMGVWCCVEGVVFWVWCFRCGVLGVGLVGVGVGVVGVGMGMVGVGVVFWVWCFGLTYGLHHNVNRRLGIWFKPDRWALVNFLNFIDSSKPDI